MLNVSIQLVGQTHVLTPFIYPALLVSASNRLLLVLGIK